MERVWQKTMERKRSAEREVAERNGNRAGSGRYRNRLERGVAFSPLTLRSHALNGANVRKAFRCRPNCSVRVYCHACRADDRLLNTVSLENTKLRCLVDVCTSDRGHIQSMWIVWTTTENDRVHSILFIHRKPGSMLK